MAISENGTPKTKNWTVTIKSMRKDGATSSIKQPKSYTKSRTLDTQTLHIQLCLSEVDYDTVYRRYLHAPRTQLRASTADPEEHSEAARDRRQRAGECSTSLRADPAIISGVKNVWLSSNRTLSSISLTCDKMGLGWSEWGSCPWIAFIGESGKRRDAIDSCHPLSLPYLSPLFWSQTNKLHVGLASSELKVHININFKARVLPNF